LDYLFFFIYLIVFCVFINKIPFVKKAGLGSKLIGILFLYRIIGAVSIGWISYKFAPENDYWSLHNEGLIEFNLLKSNPSFFLKGLLPFGYNLDVNSFFSTTHSYWNELRNNIIIKFLALLNFMSFGSYFINALFINVFAFLGSIGLYRTLVHIYKEKNNLLIFCCFLIPTTIYFSAGIHKDAVVFGALGLYSYALYFMAEEGFSYKKLILFISSFLILVLMRNFLLLALIPATIGFLMSKKYGINHFKILIAFFILGTITVVITENFFPKFHPLQIITQRKIDFDHLKLAHSQFNSFDLKPTLSSFLKNSPSALNHGFLRPYIWETSNIFSFLLSVELFIFEVLILMWLFFSLKYGHFKKQQFQPFLFYMLLIAMIMILTTGFIVPNYNSIARYRSLFLPYLITPILMNLYSIHKSKLKS
jgi:hypothetical protein